MAAPAYADSEQVSGEAVVVTPLSFIEVDDLNFGTIVPHDNSSPGNFFRFVTLEPFGNRTADAGITLVGSNHDVAEFAGQGIQNQIVEISVASNRINLTGPGANMRVDRFTVGSTPTTILTTNPRFFRIGSPTGIFRFPVGARLRVRRNQTPGTYTGQWTITLNYQ